jgi:hypothetical protein
MAGSKGVMRRADVGINYMNMKNHLVLIVFIFITFYSCINEKREFPEVRDLSEFKKTEFLPTIESTINNDKNAIYCVTLLFAWDEVKRTINKPFQIDKEFHDLNLINSSTTHINVLKRNEYSSYGQIDGNLIRVRSEFSKSLPFEHELSRYNQKLKFENTYVTSFGAKGGDWELLKMSQIVYYENDNNFILRLLPKDNNHEIILFKPSFQFNSFYEMVNEIERLEKIGLKEAKTESHEWKYNIEDDDEVLIPVLSFNIEAAFPNIEGTYVSAGIDTFRIVEARQRTAFILDEKGAEIESEAWFSLSYKEKIEQPKNLIFDKPFFIVLRRSENKYPYFGLWVSNTELMIK